MITYCNIYLLFKNIFDGTYYAFYCFNRIVFNIEGDFLLWKASKK